MRIALIGAGGIGSAFAFQLARVGEHDITVVARPGSPRLMQLARDQGIVKATGERVDVHVTDTLQEQIAYDLVLVTVLAHQVEAVVPALKRSAAKRIQFMFNNFEPEKLRDAVGADRCSFGMPFIQATLDAGGKLKAKIGAGGQKCKMDSEECVAIFNEAGVPAVFEPEMLLWLRCHAPLGAALESACVAGMRRGGGASWAESLAIARGMQESFTLIQRLGYRLYPSVKAWLHTAPTSLIAVFLWSLSRVRSVRELLATGVNECRALVDVLEANATQVLGPDAVSKILAMKPVLETAETGAAGPSLGDKPASRPFSPKVLQNKP
jgi:2-dehydropantoate 2-reductase